MSDARRVDADVRVRVRMYGRGCADADCVGCRLDFGRMAILESDGVVEA
jgi:uncharacterized Fe-S cluster-containing radical SAM superfamily protein